MATILRAAFFVGLFLLSLNGTAFAQLTGHADKPTAAGGGYTTYNVKGTGAITAAQGSVGARNIRVSILFMGQDLKDHWHDQPVQSWQSCVTVHGPGLAHFPARIDRSSEVRSRYG